jgi:uncharacterized DUF497 family protein
MAGTRFDWDPDKAAENERKHGVPFIRAQYALPIPAVLLPRTLRTVKPKTGFTVSASLTAAF